MRRRFGKLILCGRRFLKVKDNGSDKDDFERAMVNKCIFIPKIYTRTLL